MTFVWVSCLVSCYRLSNYASRTLTSLLSYITKYVFANALISMYKSSYRNFLVFHVGFLIF